MKKTITYLNDDEINILDKDKTENAFFSKTILEVMNPFPVMDFSSH